MPVPKRRVSRSRKGKRSAAKKTIGIFYLSCQHCGAHVLPHQVCNSCGYYKEVKVITTKLERLEKREFRKHEKRMREEEKLRAASAATEKDSQNTRGFSKKASTTASAKKVVKKGEDAETKKAVREEKLKNVDVVTDSSEKKPVKEASEESKTDSTSETEGEEKK